MPVAPCRPRTPLFAPQATAGDTIVVTMTETVGTAPYGDTPTNTNTPAATAWPELIPRDAGWYTVTSNPLDTTDPHRLFGDKIGERTWTWTITVQRDFQACSDGAAVVSFDLYVPNTGVDASGKRRDADWTITAQSGWGTNTTTVTGAPRR